MPYDPKDDHYATIGVADNATADEIKRAYREKAKLLHPDGHRSPELATRATQQLNAAYAVLGDPVKRRKYDEERAAYRLRENEPEIQRRVAEALAHMNRKARPSQSGNSGSSARERTGERLRQPRKRAEERLRQAHERVDERLRQSRESATKRRAQAKARTPLELVPKQQLGVFSRLAESKVNGLLREDRTFDAVLLGVGAAVLDAWLGTVPPRRR
jgi:curved DNA-binding protein CbpA